MSRKNETTRMNLSKLRPYPLQADYYDPPSPAAQEALAADLREHGQRDAIHIMPARNKAGLPANTVLDGHLRAELLAANGEVETDVFVRNDLVAEDRATVDAIFLGYNSNRRQLHPLDQILIAVRLFELQVGRKLDRLSSWDRAELQRQLKQRTGQGSRNVARYLRVVNTPREVQRAVRDGRLPLVAASQVEGLPRERQEKIASLIGEGDDPKAVVEEALAPPGSGPTMGPFTRLCRTLEKVLPDLEDATDGMPQWLVGPRLPLLHNAHKLLGRIIKKSK